MDHRDSAQPLVKTLDLRFGIGNVALSRRNDAMPRQATAAETAEIVHEAEAYLDLPTEELLRMLDDAIDSADSLGLAHRGTGDKGFWRDYTRRLKQELLQQRLVASATAGFAASKAIVRAHEVGLDLNDYRIPIAITVALAVKSFWDQMDAASDEAGKDGMSDGDVEGE